MKAIYLPLIASLAIACAMGCSDHVSSSTSGNASSSTPVNTSSSASGNASSSSSITVAPKSDRWLGRWNGPEGTFLQIEGGNGSYEITIQNLDGPQKFQGVAADSGIEFERDGVKEVIRVSNGADTGMKWLAGKSNCLTIRIGEGYCQD